MFCVLQYNSCLWVIAKTVSGTFVFHIAMHIFHFILQSKRVQGENMSRDTTKSK